jgi:hypothetical protein
MGFGGRGLLSVANEAQPVYQNVVGKSPTPQVQTVIVTADEDNTGTVMFGPFSQVSAVTAARIGQHLLAAGESVTLAGVNLAEWYAVSATASQAFRWIVAVA